MDHKILEKVQCVRAQDPALEPPRILGENGDLLVVFDEEPSRPSPQGLGDFAADGEAALGGVKGPAMPPLSPFELAATARCTSGLAQHLLPLAERD